MHRIDAPGATVGNLFTEGNPALGVPATEVSDDWLNDTQEEIVNVIEGQGITLVKGTQTQLQSAIFDMIGQGGSNIKLDPLLNSTATQAIAGLIFDKTIYKGAVFFFDCHRESDSSNVQESGLVMANYDSKDDVWRITPPLLSGLDDAGLTWTITGTGQVQIGTDNLTGTNYDGQIRVTGIMRFKQ